MRRPIRWGVKCVLLPFRIIPPTSSLSGLRPQFTVGLPRGRPTLKGGVILLSPRQVIYAWSRNQNFSNSPDLHRNHSVRTYATDRTGAYSGISGNRRVAAETAAQWSYSWAGAARSGLRSAHGLAASNAAAARKMSSSRRIFETICMPTGRPSQVHPAGTEAAGWPVRLNG